MQLDPYNTFCKSLPHATHIVQWGGAHVWKIGGKVFAIAGWRKGEGDESDPDMLSVTFKVSPLAFDILKEQPGLRPAPYLASRGMKWIQRTSDETMSEADLKDYITQSYRLVGAGLSKKKQRALGLLE